MVVNFTEFSKADERNRFRRQKQELSFGLGYFDFQVEMLSRHLEIQDEIRIGNKCLYDLST